MPDAMAEQKKTTRGPKTTGSGFTAEERAAMRERAKELKAEARADAAKLDGTKEVLAKLKTMPPADRAIGQRIHELVTSTAPELMPRLWYGMPAYAKDGKVLCFFQDAAKFKARYATLGFSDVAGLDDGAMWATSFAITSLTPAEEKKIVGLVKKAVR